MNAPLSSNKNTFDGISKVALTLSFSLGIGWKNCFDTISKKLIFGIDKT